MIFIKIALLLLSVGAAPLDHDHEKFLKIKCQDSTFLRTLSPACMQFIHKNSSTITQNPLHPFTPTTIHATTISRPSTTTNPIISSLNVPANTTILIFPTPAANPISANLAIWVKALIGLFSVVSSIYGGIVSYLRFRKKWDGRRAFSLGLAGGRHAQGSLRVKASSIPLRLRVGEPASI